MLRRFVRSFFISLSRAGWARRMVSGWGLAWRAASRFVAGDTVDDAIRVIQALNERGINATLDHLGENTTNPEEAQQSTEEVLHALRAIDAAGVRANVSLKLSQIGIVLAEELCRQNLLRILQEAERLNNFIRIDMEDSSLTERTVAMYLWARQQGFDNTGIVIQSYLYRSGQDVAAILACGGRVRLCKGAYDEPSSVAFPKKSEVDASFDELAVQLMQGAQQFEQPEISSSGRVPPIPALATHDEARVRLAKAAARRLGVPKGALEFQMLYGIRRELQDGLAAEGYPVRVYVPYGDRWYPYFMRRLAERPENLWFFVSNFFKR
jgi:proline dehydrogenase